MKPFQSGKFFASWLLRLTVVWFIYTRYFNSFTGFDFKSFNFYVSTVFVIFAILLIVGGVIQKPSLTVVSGLAIFILPVVQLIRSFPDNWSETLLIYLLPIAVGFYFFSSGNDK